MSAFGRLEGKVDSLIGQVSSVKGTCDNLSDHVIEMNGKLGKLEASVDSVRKNPCSGYQVLSPKVNEVKGRVSVLQKWVAALAAAIVISSGSIFALQTSCTGDNTSHASTSSSQVSSPEASTVSDPEVD